jgi:hypothetical protein
MDCLDNILGIKNSTIPGTGKGLFTKKLIPNGSRITEYLGKISTWKDADHDDRYKHLHIMPMTEVALKSSRVSKTIRNILLKASGFLLLLNRILLQAKKFLLHTEKIIGW